MIEKSIRDGLNENVIGQQILPLPQSANWLRFHILKSASPILLTPQCDIHPSCIPPQIVFRSRMSYFSNC